jgi:hypothetical protein
MTDHEKLLVALLSEPIAEPDGLDVAAAMTALLYGLGRDQRNLVREPVAGLVR